jgi:hypothetical protein
MYADKDRCIKKDRQSISVKSNKIFFHIMTLWQCFEQRAGLQYFKAWARLSQGHVMKHRRLSYWSTCYYSILKTPVSKLVLEARWLSSFLWPTSWLREEMRPFTAEIWLKGGGRGEGRKISGVANTWRGKSTRSFLINTDVPTWQFCLQLLSLLLNLFSSQRRWNRMLREFW